MSGTMLAHMHMSEVITATMRPQASSYVSVMLDRSFATQSTGTPSAPSVRSIRVMNRGE